MTTTLQTLLSGHKIVPVEATDQMRQAGVNAAVTQGYPYPWFPPCYKAIIAAAPDIVMTWNMLKSAENNPYDKNYDCEQNSHECFSSGFYAAFQLLEDAGLLRIEK